MTVSHAAQQGPIIDKAAFILQPTSVQAVEGEISSVGVRGETSSP
jgi:hypothetical protein